MLQRGTLSSVTVNLPTNVSRPLAWRWLRQAGQLLPVPTCFADFAHYVLAFLVIAGMAGLHVWTSVQTAKARMALHELQAYHVLLKQENAELLWQIGQHTDLAYIHSRAQALGFEPTFDREYVRPSAEGAAPGVAVPGPAAGDSGTPTPTFGVSAVRAWMAGTGDTVQLWLENIQAEIASWWEQVRDYTTRWRQ